MKKRNIVLLCLFAIIVTFSINVYADDCTGVISPTLIRYMETYVYKPIKIATPVLLIVLTSIDFAMVVFGSDDKKMDKAKTNFLKRVVAAAIVFFAPDIIRLLVSFVQEWSISSCLNGHF